MFGRLRTAAAGKYAQCLGAHLFDRWSSGANLRRVALTVVSARRARGLAALFAAVACVFPTAASAQGEGVFVDPNSPSGREYAIPLEDARRTGSGGNPSGPQTVAPVPAPLFGAGVTAVRGAAPRDTKRRESKRRESKLGTSGGSRSTKSGSSDSPARSANDAAQRQAAPLAAQYADPKGGSSLLLFAGGTALAVLLFALVLTRILRRVDR